jgi:ABC-type antimicrobial peptide transport system permease subunit
LVAHLGYANPLEAIGESFEFNNRVVRVIGVVRDFHATSLKKSIKPLFLKYEKEAFYTLNVALSHNGQHETIGFIKDQWKIQYPEHEYNAIFINDQISAFYKGEEQLSLLISVFAGIAIFIGCLGLYGLVLFMTATKTKEIGIRKVLGASVITIVNMFSFEFVKLIMIAFLIAAPFAWMGLNKMLENYTYQINLNWQIFIFGLIITVLIALATIAFHTIKSARANPIEALRSE